MEETSLMRVFMQYLTPFLFLFSSVVTWASPARHQLGEGQVDRKYMELTLPSIFFEKTFPQKTLHSPYDNDIRISVMSKEEAQVLSSFYFAHLPFRYIRDCCMDRALMMSYSAAKANLALAKVFVEGNLRTQSPLWGEIRWQAHVAPMVMTPEGELLVIDPAFSLSPLGLKEWLSFFAKEDATVTFMNHFGYYPDDIQAPVQEFKIYALEQASLYLMSCEFLERKGPGLTRSTGL